MKLTFDNQRLYPDIESGRTRLQSFIKKNGAFLMSVKYTKSVISLHTFLSTDKLYTLDQLKPIVVGFRKSQNFSYKDIAEKLNVSQQAYQALESSPKNVTVERLFNPNNS